MKETQWCSSEVYLYLAKLVYCCIKLVSFLMFAFGYEYWNSHKETGKLYQEGGAVYQRQAGNQVNTGM